MRVIDFGESVDGAVGMADDHAVTEASDDAAISREPAIREPAIHEPERRERRRELGDDILGSVVRPVNRRAMQQTRADVAPHELASIRVPNQALAQDRLAITEDAGQAPYDTHPGSLRCA